MFGFKPQRRMTEEADRAFDRAKADATELGRTVAARLASEYRAGRIDQGGINAGIELALNQVASAPGITLPNFIMKSMLEHLQAAIVNELRAAGLAPTYQENHQ